MKAQQDRFIGTSDGTVIARTEIAVNTVVLEVDASQLAELAPNPAVISISPVIDYTNDLEETVPYIGATAVHADPGFDGTGVTVAVLDSGVDYTHVAFGDLATVHDYDAAYGADTSDPANKTSPDWELISEHTNVVGGFDFVGEVWPFGRLAPDPDPIGCGGKDVNPDIEGADRLRRRPRHARRRHHRRPDRRRTRRRDPGRQGLLSGLHLLQRRRAAARHGLRPRPERRRRHH